MKNKTKKPERGLPLFVVHRLVTLVVDAVLFFVILVLVVVLVVHDLSPVQFS
jgi:hypothetical protein